jgi:hypothetical protein
MTNIDTNIDNQVKGASENGSALAANGKTTQTAPSEIHPGILPNEPAAPAEDVAPIRSADADSGAKEASVGTPLDTVSVAETAAGSGRNTSAVNLNREAGGAAAGAVQEQRHDGATAASTGTNTEAGSATAKPVAKTSGIAPPLDNTEGRVDGHDAGASMIASDGQADDETSTTTKRGTTIERFPKRGEADSEGRTIQKVYWASKKFFIYRADEQVHYLLPDDYETAHDIRKRIFKLTGTRSNIERLRTNPAIRASEKEWAATELAGALAEAIERDVDADADAVAAVNALKGTEVRLTSLIKSAYRKRYIKAVILAFLAIVVALAIVRMLLPPDTAAYHKIEVARIGEYAGYAIFGALGAFFSVAMGIRAIDLDLDLGRWEYFFAGTIRICIGVLSGVVVGLAINSNFLNPNFSTSEPALAVFYFLAFLAGFSETLVPNLLKRGDEAAEGSMVSTNGSDHSVPKSAPAQGM